MMRRRNSEIGPGHLASQLRDALAEDPRMNVLDIEVRIVDGRVHLHGDVPSEELKRQAQAIAEELSEGMPVVNRLNVGGEPAQSPRNEQIC
jgi:osmotically-inducible protein OsmY